METKTAITALAALAQDSRLAIFRALVQAGPAGLAAGRISELTGIAPSSLSFHLKELSHAGLADSRQDGRFVIYSARFETMNGLLDYLTDNCCGGNPCTPAAKCAVKPATRKPVSRKEPA
ncbi:MAG: transcriptional regulator [Hydrogenophilales bacterium 16-64-46]|nr:MAG: transcriptional regulator [Hydrogenophilales bacterium 12-64-13]OYZ05499.1 MAG: transcriptional regulator [Hydrogenophilales bacterium 16-64-46]OZA40079.1 MAG: transcriptional regulator [Hydrogenophilales bacterium 17-64-34]HQT00948.1 metalloregulator ArsR/SmtB family transcription factor [Thiobacillus sp.]